MPQGTLRIDAGPSDYAYMDSGDLNSGRQLLLFERYAVGGGQVNRAFSVGWGAGFGATDWLELGVLALPLETDCIRCDLEFQLSPPFWDGVEGYARAGLLRPKEFQVGFQATLEAPTATGGLRGDRHWSVGLGFPIRSVPNDVLRLDYGVEFEHAVGTRPVNVDLPFAVSINLLPYVFVGARSGFRSYTFEDPEGDFWTVQMPIGFFVGVTVADIVDLTADLRWIDFFEVTNTNPIDLSGSQFRLGANVYWDIL